MIREHFLLDIKPWQHTCPAVSRSHCTFFLRFPLCVCTSNSPNCCTILSSAFYAALRTISSVYLTVLFPSPTSGSYMRQCLTCTSVCDINLLFGTSNALKIVKPVKNSSKISGVDWGANSLAIVVQLGHCFFNASNNLQQPFVLRQENKFLWVIFWIIRYHCFLNEKTKICFENIACV